MKNFFSISLFIHSFSSLIIFHSISSLIHFYNFFIHNMDEKLLFYLSKDPFFFFSTLFFIHFHLLLIFVNKIPPIFWMKKTFLSICLFVHSFIFSFIDLSLFICFPPLFFFFPLVILFWVSVSHTCFFFHPFFHQPYLFSQLFVFFSQFLEIFIHLCPFYFSLFIHFDFFHIFLGLSSTFPFSIYLSIHFRSLHLLFHSSFSYPFHSNHLFSFFIFFIHPLVPPQLFSSSSIISFTHLFIHSCFLEK